MRKNELRDFNLLEKLKKSIGRLKDVGFLEDSLDFKVKINPEDGSALIQLKSKEVRNTIEKTYKKIPLESLKNCVNTVSFLKKGVLLKDNLNIALGTLNWVMSLAVNNLRKKQGEFRKKITKFFKNKEITVAKISIYFSEAQWCVLIQAGSVPISLSHQKLDKIFALAEKIA